MGNERVMEKKGKGKKGSSRSRRRKKKLLSKDKKMDNEKYRGKEQNKGVTPFLQGVIHSSPSPQLST